MAGRSRRTKGRLAESIGALVDNKRFKDKGRFERVRGTAKKRASKAARKVKRGIN